MDDRRQFRRPLQEAAAKPATATVDEEWLVETAGPREEVAAGQDGMIKIAGGHAMLPPIRLRQRPDPL